MKKLFLVAALSCAMVLGLTACGGSDSSAQSTAEPAAAASSAAESTGESTPAEGSASAGEIFDVGDFTVTVPEGWMASPQSDVLAEQDEEGNYPVSTKQIGLIKGGESDMDAFSKPTIYIYLTDGKAADSADMNKMFYDEVSDISVSINGKECAAFEAKSASFSDDEKFYVYNMVFYPISDDQFIQFNIPIDMIDFAGVNIDDPDVQTILNGVSLK